MQLLVLVLIPLPLVQAYAYADGGYSTDETTGSTALATYAPASGAA